jgi:hypothetical protein
VVVRAIHKVSFEIKTIPRVLSPRWRGGNSGESPEFVIGGYNRDILWAFFYTDGIKLDSEAYATEGFCEIFTNPRSDFIQFTLNPLGILKLGLPRHKRPPIRGTFLAMTALGSDGLKPIIHPQLLALGRVLADPQVGFCEIFTKRGFNA